MPTLASCSSSVAATGRSVAVSALAIVVRRDGIVLAADRALSLAGVELIPGVSVPAPDAPKLFMTPGGLGVALVGRATVPNPDEPTVDLRSLWRRRRRGECGDCVRRCSGGVGRRRGSGPCPRRRRRVSGAAVDGSGPHLLLGTHSGSGDATDGSVKDACQRDGGCPRTRRSDPLSRSIRNGSVPGRRRHRDDLAQMTRHSHGEVERAASAYCGERIFRRILQRGLSFGSRPPILVLSMPVGVGSGPGVLPRF